MLKKIYKIAPYWLLLIHLIIGFGVCVYITCFTSSTGGDTLEHMHSSYLVYSGKIPYRDFFQHHNPLLWFLYSPLLGLFDKGLSDTFITNFVLISALVASYLNLYYLFLITKRFLSNSLSGVIAAAIALTPYVVLSIVHFRPDNFMFLAFFAGLYYYFCYIETKKLSSLCISFVLFWCSFMFLQKIIFTLVLLAIITLYLIYKKMVNFTDILYAIMLPFTLSLGFLLYLYNYDMIGTWYHSNFTFNLHIPELFTNRRIGYFWVELKLLVAFSFISIAFLIKHSNIYYKILAIIFVAEFIQRLFYFSAFAYYLCLLVYVASILSAVFISNVLIKKHYAFAYIVCFALFFSMYKPAIYEGNIAPKKSRFHTPLHMEIYKRTTKCDYVLNGDGTIYNIYNKDPHYYWNLLGQTDVIGAKVGIAPLMDINNVIKTKKPRVISIRPYYDKYYSERGQKIVVHYPDMAYINKYYKPFNLSENLYILKSEYTDFECNE
ncbi:MAG: glycosyltransferase family 39 protein [Alphaproteobacteria bacterium]|nr:glycosyltransferase family 39 protein [Alphaproteobacteria bacterium]